MNGFYESLTEEEKAALSHLTLSYLDDVLPEAWDEGSQRIDYNVNIEGKNVIVQGFKNWFFKANTYRIKGLETDLDHERLIELSSISNYREKNQDDLKEYLQPAYGTLLANQSNGNFNLFDSPVQTQNAISLAIKDACLHGDLEGNLKAGDKVRVRSSTSTVYVNLAPEQYIRFVRSQSVKVPCTISRRGGYMNEVPEQDFLTANKEARDVHVKASEAVSALNEVAQKVIDLLESGKITSQKRFAELEELLNHAEKAYKDCFKVVSKVQVGAVSRIQQDFIKRMINQVELEVQSLPNDQKQKALHLLKDISEDL